MVWGKGGRRAEGRAGDGLTARARARVTADSGLAQRLRAGQPVPARRTAWRRRPAGEEQSRRAGRRVRTVGEGSASARTTSRVAVVAARSEGVVGEGAVHWARGEGGAEEEEAKSFGDVLPYAVAGFTPAPARRVVAATGRGVGANQQ